MSKTIDQLSNHEGFPKAGELIEFRGTGSLTLHDRRILNLLYEHAGQNLCDDVDHRIAVSALRGHHKGAERVSESLVRLMQTLVEVPTSGRDAQPATKRLALLSETTTADNENSPTGEVVYSFSKGMRAIIKDSTHWGRVRGAVMFAFTSKYSLSLYELISLRINRQQWHQEFELEDFRALLGVPKGIYSLTPDFLRRVIYPAELEVNGLADFGVKIEPIRRGGTMRGAVTGFRVSWWRKDIPALKEAFTELKQVKVGRLARLSGKVERVS